MAASYWIEISDESGSPVSTPTVIITDTDPDELMEGALERFERCEQCYFFFDHCEFELAGNQFCSERCREAFREEFPSVCGESGGGE